MKSICALRLLNFCAIGAAMSVIASSDYSTNSVEIRIAVETLVNAI
jgi:hypothetical protein